jgi:glycerophosphoryl diester phosphodiesterase
VKPLLIAHRGASHASPENTLAAFRRALAERAGGLELDVRLSADDVPVVFHDADLDRLTARAGPLAALPWSTLRTIEVGDSGEGIPQLGDLLPLLTAPLVLNVELKPHAQPQRVVAATRRYLEDLALRTELVISSFDPRLLALFAASPLAAPHRLALLFEDPAALSALRFLPAVDLHPSSALLDVSSLAAWSAPGRRFRAWTVDEPTEARRLLALSPDIALITNRPGPLLAELSTS